jgi:hypothetical protein
VWLRLGGLFLAGILGLAHAGDVTLTIQIRWQGAPLRVPTAGLPTAAGQIVRLTRFAALLSGAEFARTDGSVVRTDGQYGSLDAESDRLSFTVRNLPSGEYVGLGFQVGLLGSVNHRNAARWPAGHPLNPAVSGLHWSWAGG